MIMPMIGLSHVEPVEITSEMIRCSSIKVPWRFNNRSGGALSSHRNLTLGVGTVIANAQELMVEALEAP
jgi:hypothetical protein